MPHARLKSDGKRTPQKVTSSTNAFDLWECVLKSRSETVHHLWKCKEGPGMECPALHKTAKSPKVTKKMKYHQISWNTFLPHVSPVQKSTISGTIAAACFCAPPLDGTSNVLDLHTPQRQHCWKIEEHEHRKSDFSIQRNEEKYTENLGDVFGGSDEDGHSKIFELCTGMHRNNPQIPA